MPLFPRKKPKSATPDLGSVIGDYELAPFPALLSEALQQIADPEFDLMTIADLLVNDPGVTVRLLGLVNSAALSRGRKVTDVHQAVVIVGRNQLESLLISLAVKGTLPNPQVPGFDHGRFWLTSARRASIAGQLSGMVDPSRRSENFTAALLQDMALPVLAERVSGYASTLLDWHTTPGDLAALEREAYGWDHGEIASLMASNWGFPDELVDFMRAHHPPGSVDEGFLPARIVAPLRESDAVGDDHVLQLAVDHLSLPAERTLILIEEAGRDAAKLASMFS